MDDKERTAFWIGGTLGFIIAFALVTWIRDDIWEIQAIEHGAAYYDQKTGEFTWKEIIDEQ